jgi:oxygen-dependent protoporphyrinogen oxidase
MSANRIAVVGGGAAGLAAAGRLASLGADVTLFESGDHAGGRIRTIRRDGWVVEAGALLVAEPAPEVRALLDAAGLAERTVRASAAARRRYVVHQGAPQLIPATLGDLIASPLLSVAGRLRMAREPFVSRRAEGEDESVDAFARRRFGDEVAERLFDSLVAEMSAGDATHTLVRYLFPKLVEFEQSAGSVLKGQMRAGMEARRRLRGKPSGAWSCPTGLDEMTTALSTRPRMRCCLSTAVDQITAFADAIALRSGSANERFDGIVLTVPPPALARIEVPAPWRDAVTLLATIPHAPVASVSLGFARSSVSHPLDGMSIRVPSAEGRPLLSILVPSAVFGGRAPEGHVLLTCLVGGVSHPDVVALPAAELVALVRQQLADLVGVKGEPAFTEVTAWPAAFPQAVSGHAARLAAAEQLEQLTPRVVLSGSWRDGLVVSDVLRGGIRAADRLAARLGLGQTSAV